VRELLRRTSAARDLDVQIAELGAINRLTRNRAMKTPLDDLSQQRARQQINLLRLLNSPRTARLFAALDRLMQYLARFHDRRTVAQVARQLLQLRYRKLRNAALRVTRNPSAARCHAMRLQTKNLRYVAELLEPTYGKPMRRFLRRLQKLQSILGQINDAHHAIEFLQSQRRRRRRLSPEAVAAMTHMAGRHSRHLARNVSELPEVWRRASGKRWHRLCRCLRTTAV
jgi:CHAD domain-containing protein